MQINIFHTEDADLVQLSLQLGHIIMSDLPLLVSLLCIKYLPLL